ncbi:hypothetical protein M758_3G194300 [Ceratodon purpureus]|nr:hypothetical protein M758_3G194300 [Ceratodon purpureus]
MATSVRPPRAVRTRAALTDVTNTSSVTVSRTRSVAKVAVEASKDEHVAIDLKKSSGKVASKPVRKAKEQVQLESKFGNVGSKSVAVKKNATLKPALTKIAVEELSSAEALVSSVVEQEQELVDFEASKRSSTRKLGASSKENLSEAEFKLKSTSTTRMRAEPTRSKKSRAIDNSEEASKDVEASPPSVQAVGVDNLTYQVQESESALKTTTVTENQGVKLGENLTEAGSKLKITAVTKRKTEPAKAKKTRAIGKPDEIGEASPSSVQVVGIENLDTCVLDQVRESGLATKTRALPQKRGVKPRENLTEADAGLKITNVTKRGTELAKAKKSRAIEKPEGVREASPSSVQAEGIENRDASQGQESSVALKTRTVAQKQGVKLSENLIEAESTVKITTVSKRRTEPAKAKKTRVIEKSKEIVEASSSLVGIEDLDASVSDEVLESGSVQKSRTNVKRGSVAVSSSKGRQAAGGLKVPSKPLQDDLEMMVAQIGDKNPHLQTPGAGSGPRTVDVIVGQSKGKKASGKIIANEDQTGASSLTRVTSASKYDSCAERPLKSTSVMKVTRGVSGDPAQTVRRNASRGARKAVNYSEDALEGQTVPSRKVTPVEHNYQLPPLVVCSDAEVTRIVRQTVRKRAQKDVEVVQVPGSDAMTSAEKNLQDSESDNRKSTSDVQSQTQAKLSVGEIQTVKRTVRKTVRKGRTKVTVADDIARDDVILIAEKDLHIPILSNLESCLEEEYERFKMENRMQKESAKLLIPSVVATPFERILIDSAKPLTRCSSLKESTSEITNSNENGVVESLSDVTHDAELTENVKVTPVPASLKSDLGVDTPTLNGSVEPVSCSATVETTTSSPLCRISSQRGQKRSWKENVEESIIASPVRTECTLPIAESVQTSSLKLDIDPIVERDDQDNDHVNDADSQMSVIEYEDLICADVVGRDSDDPLLKPIANFDEADIPARVKDCCKLLGKPSTIQSYSLPFLLAGRDLVAISNSTTEQILAYGVPILVHVMKKKRSYVRKRPSPIGLVLASSDELSQKITDVLENSFRPLRVKIGRASSESTSEIKPGVAILVATPSCLQQMLEDGSCSLALVSFIVLDGADCMVQSGMDASLRDIFDQAPAYRQTGVFSSTLEPETEQVVNALVSETDLVKIQIKNPILVPEQIDDGRAVTQIVEVLEDSDRDARLTALLRTFQKGKKNRVLVYVLYKEEALHVEGLLQQRGWKVAAVHGGIFEADRNKAVVSFQKGSSSVLVATDVAARGLVIPNVDYIINYSFPYTFEDYECRLRQTGQTGRKGIMHTFFMPGNQARAKELVEVLREAEQDVPENLVKLTSPAQKKPRIEY